MSQSKFSLNARAVLLMAISSAYPVIGYGAPAAQVDFSVGNVTATGSNGQSRTLGKGAQIEQGDTVNTNGGRAQLRFTDGAYVSLQPESQFRIDQYQFNGKTDGSEKGLFSLLKGGLRTITGLLGRTNKANYQVSTVVATIGIRGTEYTIQYGNSVSGTVGEGEIEVCNGAGCLSVTNGESYYVQSQEIKPVLTAKRTDLPPPEPEDPPANFAKGEDRDAAGNVLPGFVLNGNYVTPDLTGAYAYNGDGILSGTANQATFDSSGNLIVLNGLNGEAQGLGNDGFVAWGTFVGAPPNSQTYAYVVGLATPSADISSLANGNMRATYTLTGSTPVIDGSGAAIGSLDSAALSVQFTGISVPSSSLSADMNWTINGSAVSATLAGGGTGSAFNLGCGGNRTACGGGLTSVDANGAFFGPDALRSGFAYIIDNNQLGGAAAFSRTASQ